MKHDKSFYMTSANLTSDGFTLETDDITKYSSIAGFEYEESENKEPIDINSKATDLNATQNNWARELKELEHKLDDTMKMNQELIVQNSELESDIQCRNREIYESREHIQSLSEDLRLQKDELEQVRKNMQSMITERDGRIDELLNRIKKAEEELVEKDEYHQNQSSAFVSSIVEMEENITELSEGYKKWREDYHKERERRKHADSALKSLQKMIDRMSPDSLYERICTKIDRTNDCLLKELMSHTDLIMRDIHQRASELTPSILIKVQESHEAITDLVRKYDTLPEILKNHTKQSCQNTDSGESNNYKQDTFFDARKSREQVLNGLRTIASSLKPLDTKTKKMAAILPKPEYTNSQILQNSCMLSTIPVQRSSLWDSDCENKN